LKRQARYFLVQNRPFSVWLLRRTDAWRIRLNAPTAAPVFHGTKGIGAQPPQKKVERVLGNLDDYPTMEHVSDSDLERYMIPDGPELAALEEHLLIYRECVDRAEETQDYVDAIQAGIIRGRFDL
jgi:hypothetical protein